MKKPEMTQSTRILILLMLVVLAGGAYWKFVMSAEPAVEDFGSPPIANPSDPGAVDPGGANSGATPGTPQDPGAPGAAGNPAAPSGGLGAAAKGAGTTLAAEPHSGNNVVALQFAQKLGGIVKRNKLAFEFDVQLTPVAGGFSPKVALVRRYRPTVRSASLRVRVADEATMEQWQSNPVKTRRAVIQNWLVLLGKDYPKATRSVVVVDANDSLLGSGDSTAAGKLTLKIEA